MKKEFIFDLLEDELDSIDEETIIIETGADLEKIKSLYTSKLHPAAKKVTPVRRRFMFGLAAALITAATIATAAAVVAQTNGNKAVTAEVSKPEKNILRKLDEDELMKLKNQISYNDEIAVSEMMRNEFGYDTDNMSADNITPRYEIDLIFAKAEYGNRKYGELINKVINAGYGDSSLLFTEKDHDYVKNKEGIYVSNHNFDSNEFLEKYYKRTIACCNAYNDPDFEMTDEERVRMVNLFNKDYENIYRAVTEDNKHNDTMIEAFELIDKTIVPENGYKTLN